MRQESRTGSPGAVCRYVIPDRVSDTSPPRWVRLPAEQAPREIACRKSRPRCGNVRSWQILLQKSLPVSVRGDSVALMRFATEAGDYGATQSRSKTAFLFIPSRGCGSRRSFGLSDCWGSRPVMGACRACTVLSKAWETFDRSGAYDSDAGRWLRFCDSLRTSTLPGRTSQSCLPLVLWPSIEDKVPDHSALSRARNEHPCNGRGGGLRQG